MEPVRAPGSPLPHGADAASSEEHLLALVAGLIADLHSQSGTPEVALSSRLDRDLGLDSVSRVELLERLERAFSRRLNEEDVMQAEVVADLLTALQRPTQSPGPGPSRSLGPLRMGAPAAPATGGGAETLVDALRLQAKADATRVHAQFIAVEAEPQVLSYGDLYDGAARVAAGLLNRGIRRGDRLALMLPTGPEYLRCFCAAWLVGAVPVPLYPPSRPGLLEEHMARQQRILENAKAALMITVREAIPLTHLMKRWLSLHVVTTAEDLTARAAAPDFVVTPKDLALLQYTSGSTGDPKGVMLTHDNLVANIRAMGDAVKVTPDDVMVSWLPLYHDMGLIGGWLSALYFGFPVVLMSPMHFLTKPARWLQTIDKVRGTLSAAPNFAYDLCSQRIPDTELEGIDLSCWRFALNGSEPVSAQSVEDFCKRFAAHGFRRGAMSPAYGLAECAVGLTFPPLMRGPHIDRVSRASLMRAGHALPAPANADKASSIELVACGHSLRDHEVKIVDDLGSECADRHVGQIEFRGPSATRGYFGRQDETERLFHNGWLRSGDLGYMAEGDLYLTGRSKDMIIRAGQHIFPQEIEEAVGALQGVRKGCVAAFASASPRAHTEGLIVVAETREQEPTAKAELTARISATCSQLLGAAPDRIVLVPPHSVPKTSSGKLRRSACRLAYERGQLGARRRSAFAQLLLTRVRGLVSESQQLRRAVAELSYAGYVWSAFLGIALVAWPILLVLPRLGWRISLARMAARLLGRMARVRVTVEGLEHLPEGPFLLAANHQSNIDPFVLVAVLPRQVCIVSKAELSRHWWTRVPLDRLGVEYVERGLPTQSVNDARRIARRARMGVTLLFFPEGTHSRVPGLLPFHMGAFVTAAQAALPIVPVVLEGTRSILRSDTQFPRHGAIHVRIGAPMQPSGSGFDAALGLKRAVRAYMLEQTKEPDLSSWRTAEPVPDAASVSKAEATQRPHAR